MLTKHEKEKHSLIYDYIEKLYSKNGARLKKIKEKKISKGNYKEDNQKNNFSSRKFSQKGRSKNVSGNLQKIDTLELDEFLENFKKEEEKSRQQNEDRGGGYSGNGKYLGRIEEARGFQGAGDNEGTVKNYFTEGFEAMNKNKFGGKGGDPGFFSNQFCCFQTGAGKNVNMNKKNLEAAMKLLESDNDIPGHKDSSVSQITLRDKKISQKFEFKRNFEIVKKVEKIGQRSDSKPNNPRLFEETRKDYEKNKSKSVKNISNKFTNDSLFLKKRDDDSNFASSFNIGKKAFTFGFAGAGGQQIKIDQDKLAKARALFQDDDDNKSSLNFGNFENKKKQKSAKIFSFKNSKNFGKNVQKGLQNKSKDKNSRKRRGLNLNIKQKKKLFNQKPPMSTKKNLKRTKGNNAVDCGIVKLPGNPKKSILSDFQFMNKKLLGVRFDLKMFAKYTKLNKTGKSVSEGHCFLTSNLKNKSINFDLKTLSDLFQHLKSKLSSKYRISTQKEFLNAIKSFIYINMKECESEDKSNFLDGFGFSDIKQKWIEHHIVKISRKAGKHMLEDICYICNQIFNRYRIENVLKSYSCLMKIFKNRKYQEQSIVLRVEDIDITKANCVLTFSDGWYDVKIKLTNTKIPEEGFNFKNKLDSELHLLRLVKNKRIYKGLKMRFSNSKISPELEKSTKEANLFDTWILEAPFNSISRITNPRKKLGFCLEKLSRPLSTICDNSGKVNQIDVTILHIKGANIMKSDLCVTGGMFGSKIEGKQIKVIIRVVDTINFLKKDDIEDKAYNLEINYADVVFYKWLTVGSRLVIANVNPAPRDTYYDLYDQFSGENIEELKKIKIPFKTNSFKFPSLEKKKFKGMKSEIKKFVEANPSLEILEKIRQRKRVPYIGLWLRYITHSKSKALFYLEDLILVMLELYNYTGRDQKVESKLWEEINPLLKSNFLLFYDLEFNDQIRKIEFNLKKDDSESQVFEIFSLKYKIGNSSYQCKEYYENCENFMLKNLKNSEKKFKELRKRKISKQAKDYLGHLV